MPRRKPQPRPLGEITWVDTSRSPADSARTARELAQLLTGLPQPDPEAPAAFRTAPAELERSDWQLSQCPYPLSYREAAQHLTLFAWDQDPRYWAEERLSELGISRDRLKRYVKPLRTRGHVVGSGVPHRNGTRQPRRPAVINHRPGVGGRQPRLDRQEPETALAELRALLGEPVLWRVSNEFVEAGLVAVWDARNQGVSEVLDPRGNTLIQGRMSSDDRRNDETPPNHILPCLDLCERFELLRPRMVVMCVDVTGTADMEYRPDLQLAETAIKSGWARHVVWRSGDRIAREIVPAEFYYRLLKQHGVGLWLAVWGRKVQWNTDRLALRAQNMVSSEEREMSTQRMQHGALTQGPLAGRGWLGSPPRFGLIRQRKELVVDEEQWEWIKHIFFLARQLEDGSPNSTRKLAEKLGKRCPFDHEHIRAILQDPIYVTGEWAVWVRGVLVAQKPIHWPGGGIPASVFQEVQNILRLNQGRTSRTPLGEFLLNYVECVHLRCLDAPRKNGARALIKGYMENTHKKAEPHKVGRYGHYPFCPDQCRNQGFRWDKTELEHPIIRAAWQLIEHPELRKALDGQSVYPVSHVRGALQPAQRRELERQVERVRARKEAAEREWMDMVTGSDDAEVDMKGLWQEIVMRVDEELQELEARLIDDDLMRADEDPNSTRGIQRNRRRVALREVLTLDTPDDPKKRALRAAVFQKLFPRVEIGEDEQGRLIFRLFSNLVPAGIPSLASSDPIEVVADELDRHWESEYGRPLDEQEALTRFERQAASAPIDLPDAFSGDGLPGEPAEAHVLEPWLDEQAQAAALAEQSELRDRDQGHDKQTQTALGASDYKAVRGNVYELLARPSRNAMRRAEKAQRNRDGAPKRRSSIARAMVHAWCSEWITVETGLRVDDVRARLKDLDPRYAAVLEERLQGRDLRQIADRSGLAVSTVRGYLSKACGKLGLRVRDLPSPGTASGARTSVPPERAVSSSTAAAGAGQPAEGSARSGTATHPGAAHVRGDKTDEAASEHAGRRRRKRKSRPSSSRDAGYNARTATYTNQTTTGETQ